MNNKINFKLNELYVWCTFIFLFYLLISILTPLAADDFKWANAHNLTVYKGLIEYTNGRYLDNLLELIAMKISVLRYLLYAGISMSMVYLLVMMTGKYQRRTYIIIAFIVILMMPRIIYRDTYGNFAGFFSYVPSTVLSILILFVVVVSIYKCEELNTTWISLFLISTLLGQLFVENLTLYNMLILIIGNVIFVIRNRHINYYLIMGFMLSLIGGMLMFINPIYISIYRGGNEYLRFSDNQGLKHKILHTIFKELPEYIFINQYLILTVIAFITIYLLFKNTFFNHWILRWKVVLVVSLAMLPFYKFFIYDFLQFYKLKGSLSVALFNLMICGWFYIALFIATYVIFKAQFVRMLGYYTLGSILLVTVPLLLVSPITPGNFYTIYVLWSLYLLLLMTQCRVNAKSLHIGIRALALGLSMIFIVTFSMIYFTHIQRLNSIEHQLHTQRIKHVVVLEKLPFENMLNKATPSNDIQHNLFKIYYDIPQNVNLKIVPYGSNMAKLEGD
ncbi:hypothetical protein EYQ96_03960 [Staphylococcus warneri]|uniref:hypothetical protein n=1 Tax=Staphylococcus warneri TaxID=1292 RepID=UPI00148F246D|nr:hypothetical protein [Staphylococcus warneri]QJX55281.1 hypothetical protein EYQ96_03960 [Staphylococcus warneri]